MASHGVQLSEAAVLSVGSLPELVMLREAVLRNAGFSVFSTSSPKEALSKIKSGHCGVLLMCYSLDDVSRQHLAKQFRKCCPQGRIVLITNEPIARPLIHADAFVYGIEGAETLINAVRGNATPE